MTPALRKVTAAFFLAVIAGPSGAQRPQVTEITEAEWAAIRPQIVHPRPDLRIRREVAYLGRMSGVFAVVETNYYEESAEHRKYYRTDCFKKRTAWQCRPPYDIFEFRARPEAWIIVGPGVENSAVVEIDRFLREHPVSGWKQRDRLLASVTLRQLHWRDGEYTARVGSDVDIYCGTYLHIRRGVDGELWVTNVPSIFCA